MGRLQSYSDKHTYTKLTFFYIYWCNLLIKCLLGGMHQLWWQLCSCRNGMPPAFSLYLINIKMSFLYIFSNNVQSNKNLIGRALAHLTRSKLGVLRLNRNPVLFFMLAHMIEALFSFSIKIFYFSINLQVIIIVLNSFYIFWTFVFFAARVDFSKHTFSFLKNIHYDHLEWNLLQKSGIQIVSTLCCYFFTWFLGQFF